MIVDLEVNALLNYEVLFAAPQPQPSLMNDRKNLTNESLQVPRFDSGCQFSQDPAISYIWSEKNLNDDQRRAILKVNNYYYL